MFSERSCSPLEMEIFVPVRRSCRPLASAPWCGGGRDRCRLRLGEVHGAGPSPATILGKYVVFCRRAVHVRAARAPWISPGYMAKAMSAEVTSRSPPR